MSNIEAKFGIFCILTRKIKLTTLKLETLNAIFSLLLRWFGWSKVCGPVVGTSNPTNNIGRSI